MKTQDQAAGERADRCIEAMSSPDRCTYCDGEFDPAPHVDALHRFTPLCGNCYGDEHRRAVTARQLSATEPKTPHDWDKKIKKIYGKTPSEMNHEERRVVIAEFRAVAAYQEHCEAAAASQEALPAYQADPEVIAELSAARKAAKEAKCPRAFW